MDQNYLTRAAKYLAAQRKQKRWHKVVSGLGAAVVFCTVYALILPAITLTAPIVCGLEEHQHDESCYAVVEPVAEASLLSSMAAEESRPEVRQLCGAETVYAGLAEEEHAPFILHVHGENCYLNGELVCTLPEVATHVHDDACYVQEPILICGLEEEFAIPDEKVPAGHVHTEECYEDVLSCGLEESEYAEGHAHGEGCYTEETVPGGLVCEIEAGEEHQHGEACYGADEVVKTLTCGLEESEPVEGHTHTRSYCYRQELVCGLEETGGQEDEGTVDGHVHTEDCYILGDYVLDCGDQRIPHEHGLDCYDEYGALICGRLVVREHVHTPECFLEIAQPQPEPEPDFGTEPEKVLVCELPEHTHEDACYGASEPEESENPEESGDPENPEETGDPENPEEAGRQEEEQWKAIFWSNVVSGYSDVVLDARADGSWMDPEAMDPEELLALREAGAADLTRYLNRCGIWVDNRAYDSALHGPMDPARDFNIVLTWSMNSVNFSGMTYSYEFPDPIRVEDVEKHVLTGAGGEAVMAYSVWNNALTVTYYAPVADVTTEFSLRASWSGDVGADAEIRWSRSDSTYVTFAEPELTVEKSMGAEGLRVDEDGAVWADYTVAVTNSGMVSAIGVTLTDVLEANYFHFAQGAYGDGADYAVTVGGRDGYESFPDYDGGDTVTFPAFDLEPGESRTFQYQAVMSAADRAVVDAAVKASADPAQAAETVRNTATAVCPAPGGDLEFTSESKATYGGPESKHVENFTQTYEAGAFDVAFTVNGDAQLPVGMTQEKLERTEGEGLRLTVEALDETAEEYQAFVQHVEEEENLLDLQVLRIAMDYNGVKLELADCDVKAVVTPSEALKNYQPDRVLTYNMADEEKAAAEAEQEKGFDVELAVLGFTPQEATQQYEVQTLATLAVETETPDGEGMATDAAAVPAPQSAEIEMQSDDLAVAYSANPYPEYKVQFYAYLNRPATTGANDEKALIIDTSGGKLPQNRLGVTVTPNGNALMNIFYQDGVGLRTESKLMPIFTERTRVYNPKVTLDWQMLDNISYEVTEAGVNEVGDRHYNLKELWILKSGCNPTSVDANDWDCYDQARLATIHFTNNNQIADPSYICIDDSTVFRMVYVQNEGTHTNEVNFYDYDISDVPRASATSMITKENGHGFGINDPANYPGQKVEYAFGNSNAGTPYGNNKWVDGFGRNNWLNRFNRTDKDNNGASFNGCTFGLVAGTYSNGKISYNASSPYLFNDGAATGKTAYDKGEYTLDFRREGDTYTLRGVNNAGLTNLDRLMVARDSDGKVALQSSMQVPIWTNNFWPMDGAVKGDGSDGHDPMSGGTKKVTSSGGAMPPSDNGIAHNNYFGMQASFEFTLPEGYIGPLDYYFFGDDDLWLFLDGVLVCDLGGVKSSVSGEYVNLGEYINNGVREADGSYQAGTHRLDLYYTERGASGSTCWMQFTIPNIRSAALDTTPDGEKGSLRITKEVNGITNQTQEYWFTMKLENTRDIFSVKKFDKDQKQVDITDANGNKVTSFGRDFRFSLKPGESLAVFDLPYNTKYTITEDPDSQNTYETTIKSNKQTEMIEGKTISGTISTGDTTHYVTYTNTFYYALPETGGAGTAGMRWYTMSALPVMTAAVLVYKRPRKKGGTRF